MSCECEDSGTIVRAFTSAYGPEVSIRTSMEGEGTGILAVGVMTEVEIGLRPAKFLHITINLFQNTMSTFSTYFLILGHHIFDTHISQPIFNYKKINIPVQNLLFELLTMLIFI